MIECRISRIAKVCVANGQMLAIVLKAGKFNLTNLQHQEVER